MGCAPCGEQCSRTMRQLEGRADEGASLSRLSPELFATWRASPGRLPVKRAIEGSAIGVALWCILFAFQLLPGATADTPGLLVFLFVGVALTLTRLRIVLLAVLALSAGLVVLVAETPLSNALAFRWARQDPLPASTLPAVVVLSAGLNPNGTINSEALDHLLTGLELVRAGRATVLVTTTVEQRFPHGAVTSTTDQARIVSLFQFNGRWVRTLPGRSTRDEALRSAQLLFPPNVRRIAVDAA